MLFNSKNFKKPYLTADYFAISNFVLLIDKNCFELRNFKVFVLLKKRSSMLCLFNENLLNIMVDKVLAYRDKGIDFIFNSMRIVKIDIRW